MFQQLSDNWMYCDIVWNSGNTNLQVADPTNKEMYLDTGISCLLYTSDAADDLLCVDLGGRRIIKKKKKYEKKKKKTGISHGSLKNIKH